MVRTEGDWAGGIEKSLVDKAIREGFLEEVTCAIGFMRIRSRMNQAERAAGT